MPAPPNLARCAGTYASPQTRLQITLTPDGATRRAQTTDWLAFPSEPVSQGVFKLDQAGLRVEFVVDKPVFALKQGRSSYVFTKGRGATF